MLHDVMLALAQAHQDKTFDVVCTVCDGAAEQMATQLFGRWAKQGQSKDARFEATFAKFLIAFEHPYHLRPVFNLSDPMHLVKKLVNTLWHSDLDWKNRSLGKLFLNERTGEAEWADFSLKTLERVYVQEEMGGGAKTVEEQVADLQRFVSLTPEQFRRTKHNCMSVQLSCKRPEEAGGEEFRPQWESSMIC
ncbi:unnamed protein product, partial [Ectocarpus sp. 12 AP-2014]